MSDIWGELLSETNDNGNIEISENLKHLKEIGSDYFQSLLYVPPKKPVVNYGHRHLQIGRRISDGSVFNIELKDAIRCILIGLSGSGKTFFIKSMMDRLVKVGFDVVQLSDVKDEFKHSLKPVQEKFRYGLLEGEEPKGCKIVALRPTFFKTISKRLPKHNFWYSVHMNSLSKADFFTLLNVPDMSQTQQVSMEILYEKIRQQLKSGETFSLDMVEEIIEEIDEIDKRTKQALIFKFRPLKNSHFFEPEYERNITSLIQRGFTLSFNMDNFEEFGKSSYSFPEVTLNIALREIIKARKLNKIKKLFIFVDEAIRWVGNDKSSSLKSSILESVDLHRRVGVSYGFAVQSLGDTPEKIISQSRYIFIPAVADTNTIRTALISTGLVKNTQIARNESIRIKKRMKRFKWSWLVLDRIDQQMDLIYVLSPLSFHLEGST